MEAKALWDFEATQPDEMSFRRGNVLSVISMEDGGWYKAVMGNRTGFIPSTYIKLENHDWYKDPITREEAEQYILKVNSLGSYIYPDGYFLIRKSHREFALSVKHEDTVQHFKILTDSNNKFYIWPNTVFPSINQLVQYYHSENVSGDHRRVIQLQCVAEELYEAVYDFQPANDEEVELRRGDVIRLVCRSDENWWEGEVRGRTGFFPRNYVRRVDN
ncbi:growth factor receptor-bound protein 2 [Plakobranchus ocellatus]|uniref:Growth factor receptor-bound protein 2 n=1 Tax=Plakobranchus ocellatus TaxID=259542 RepID=A0AAV3YVT5_9GAST|nr:growth factor receptor-bound protein 2 [Plakobranchus ocellatus]